MVGLIFSITLVILPTQNLSAAYQTPITRAQVEKRALDIVNFKWNYSKDLNSNISSRYSANVTLPNQIRNVTASQVTGIPYNWGGLDSLDFKSYNSAWSNFSDAVNKGAYTGNVNTRTGLGYIPGTAGLDCSGFVQSAFNIRDSKLSTTTIFNKYFYKISLDNIKHMDILNKPGDHTVIFDKWGYKNGVYGAFTYESTTDQTYGGIQGTKQYFMSMKKINTGYIPGRYISINELTTHPADNIVSEPVESGIFVQISNVNDFANFRVSPSTTSQLIGTIPKDSILYLKSSSSGWYQVAYNGKVGWIWGNLLCRLPSGKYVVLKDAYQLNVRSTPSTTSRIITTLNKGKYAQVVGYSADKQWFKVSVDGISGWTTSKHISYIY